MVKKILIVVMVIIVIVVGFVIYSFLRTPEEASGPIEAIPINVETDTPVARTSGETVAVTAMPIEEIEVTEEPIATDVENDSSEVEALMETETPTVEPATETEPTVEPDDVMSNETTESGEATGAEPIIFQIVPDESGARFNIDEVLRGDPIAVVGATDQIGGQLAINPADLSATQVGVIQVNARTLATDNNFRNRAIKNRILLTDDYEFITFNPSDVIGLPESGEVGETYTFQVEGDLTVTDVTRPVIFDVTATATSGTRIEATATTAFLYTDFALSIPDSPSVDTVDDEVRLEIDFVAEKTQ